MGTCKKTPKQLKSNNYFEIILPHFRARRENIALGDTFKVYRNTTDWDKMSEKNEAFSLSMKITVPV